MIKHFCDQCGVEITEVNECKQHFPIFAGHLGGRDRALGFSITTGNANAKIWNGGDFCKYCVIDAVNTLDDRPTQGESA